MNKGTEIEKVIAYLEKRKQEGYTHVAITTPDKMYDSSIFMTNAVGKMKVCCVYVHHALGV